MCLSILFSGRNRLLLFQLFTVEDHVLLKLLILWRHRKNTILKTPKIRASSSTCLHRCNLVKNSFFHYLNERSTFTIYLPYLFIKLFNLCQWRRKWWKRDNGFRKKVSRGNTTTEQRELTEFNLKSSKQFQMVTLPLFSASSYHLLPSPLASPADERRGKRNTNKNKNVQDTVWTDC